MSKNNGAKLMRSLRSRFFPSTRTLSFVALMTAINVVSNYAMIGIPNIKFMDLFVFVSGYLMGVFPGAIVGFLSWLVYGSLNPLGFDLGIYIATCLCEMLYGVAGGLFERFGLHSNLSSVNVKENIFWLTNFKFGIIGFLLTFIYDLFTNIVFGLIYGLPVPLALIRGVPFAIAHEVSNFFFFFFGCSILIKAIKKIMP